MLSTSRRTRLRSCVLEPTMFELGSPRTSLVLYFGLCGCLFVALASGCGGGDDATPRPDTGVDADDDASEEVSPDVDDATDVDETDTEPRPAVCGDGVLSPSEACEAFDLRGQRCVDLGFEGGRLACSETCTLDTSLCFRCGDGVVQGDEVCDGDVDPAITCETIRGPGATGTVVCSDDCMSFEDIDCSDPAVEGPFVPCDLDDSSCSDGLDCADTSAGPICIAPCERTDDCASDAYCAPLGRDAFTCLPRPSEGDACRDTSPCADGLTCIPAFVDRDGAPSSVCARTCDACGATQACVDVPSAALELASDAACLPDDSTSCTPGFECINVDTGTAERFRCARPWQLCATPQALYGMTSGGPVDAQICDLTGPTGGGRFCPTLGEDNAEVVCFPVFGEGESLGACIGLCDDGSAEGMGDISCGREATCGTPELAALFYPMPGSPTTCTEDDRSECGADYPACVDMGDGLTCARAARICIPGE